MSEFDLRLPWRGDRCRGRVGEGRGMRLLHTADWHFGRVLHGAALLEDLPSVRGHARRHSNPSAALSRNKAALADVAPHHALRSVPGCAHDRALGLACGRGRGSRRHGRSARSRSWIPGAIGGALGSGTGRDRRRTECRRSALPPPGRSSRSGSGSSALPGVPRCRGCRGRPAPRWSGRERTVPVQLVVWFPSTAAAKGLSP
jgi:hypothetical protein